MTMRELYRALTELTERRGISLIEDEPSEGMADVKGLFYSGQGWSMIWIKPSLPLAQKISTLAHELGHYMLHRTSGTNILHRGSTDQQKEREATEYGQRLIWFLIHREG
jgi:Zn-dependent peptidase ImmA (M78 family)